MTTSLRLHSHLPWFLRPPYPKILPYWPGPCAWLRPITVTSALLLDGYKYPLLLPGRPEHGGLAISLWSDASGSPGEENTAARCLALHDGLPVGLNWRPLADTDNPTCLVEPGDYWLVSVIDRQTAGPVPIIAPPIRWLNVERSYRLRIGLGNLLSWLGEWLPDSAELADTAPDIRLSGAPI